MVSIQPVERSDLDDLFSLQVRPDQQNYVAPNSVSLAEFAFISGGYVFSIRANAQIVGLMGIINFQEHDELDHTDDPQAAFLMRMMITETHQRQGIGRASMLLAFDWARSQGNTCFQTSIVPGNDDAMQFYEAMGLRRTGRIVEREIELSLPL